MNRLGIRDAALFHSAATYDHVTADGSAPTQLMQLISFDIYPARKAVDRRDLHGSLTPFPDGQRVLPFGIRDCTTLPEVI